MAFTYVQAANATTTTSSTSSSVTLNGITAGNLLVLWVKFEGGGATTVTVSDGTSSFTAAPTQINHSNGQLNGQFFYLLSANAGNKTITATYGAARSYKRMIVSEYSYSNTAAFTDDAGNYGNSASPSSGNMTSYNGANLGVGGFGEYAGTTTSSETIAGNAASNPAAMTATYASSWYYIDSTTYTGPAAGSISSSEWVCGGICFEDVAGGTTVSATTDSLSLTEYPATVNAETSLTATSDTLAITEYPANVNAATNVSANIDPLAITEYSATINAVTNVQASTATLTLTENNATVQAGNNVEVSASAGSLSITEFNATVNSSTIVSAGTDPLVITEYPTSVSSGTNVQSTTTSLSLTEYPSSISIDVAVQANAGSLTLTPFSVTVEATTVDYTIDGLATKTISSNYGSIRIYGNGENWFTI